MNSFDEILCTDIEVRKRNLCSSSDTSASQSDSGKDNTLDSDIFPEFCKLLEGNEATGDDDDSQGCPLPGTPEDESVIDTKVNIIFQGQNMALILMNLFFLLQQV